MCSLNFAIKLLCLICDLAIFLFLCLFLSHPNSLINAECRLVSKGFVSQEIVEDPQETGGGLCIVIVINCL